MPFYLVSRLGRTVFGGSRAVRRSKEASVPRHEQSCHKEQVQARSRTMAADKIPACHAALTDKILIPCFGRVAPQHGDLACVSRAFILAPVFTFGQV